MADKDNENMENPTEEVVETNEAISENAVEVDASADTASESAEATELTEESSSETEPETAEQSAEEAPVEESQASSDIDQETVEGSADEVPAEEAKATPVSIDEKSPAQIINSFEASQLKSDIPPFRPGDTVVVSVKVQEGDRTRLQAFEGVVMNIKKAGLNSAFIVRKISSGIGVERTFQMHSPLIDSISVKRKGDVRQATLYYLRERSGRSARIKERLD